MPQGVEVQVLSRALEVKNSMNNPFLLLGIFMFFSFWWIDRAMANWKKEQDEKLDEIKDSVDSLHDDLNEKFRLR